MGSGWKSRKVVLTMFGLIGVAVGFVYGFINKDGSVILAALGAIPLILGGYSIANAYQAGVYSNHGSPPGTEA